MKDTNSELFLQNAPTLLDSKNHINYHSTLEYLQISKILPLTYSHLYQDIKSRCLTGTDLNNLIKSIYRENSHRQYSTNDAFSMIRLLNELVKLAQISSLTVSNNVRCVCTPIYDRENSDSETGHIYYYRISIENLGQDNIKLKGRHWRFEEETSNSEHAHDEETKKWMTEVKRWGDGVIGVKPVIISGGCFQYMSSVVVPTSVRAAQMQGAFLMSNLRTAEFFEANIDTCLLRRD